MISEFDIKRRAKRDNCRFSVDENNNVVNKESKEIICSLDEFTQILRKRLHCNFEVIYSCHAFLSVIYRCKDCGTVIFAKEDESYDSSLSCPTCGNYNTWFDFWTAEEIADNAEKQKIIKMYEEMYHKQVEANKMYIERDYKYDWQVWSKKLTLHKYLIIIDLECDNYLATKLKGLRLVLQLMYKTDDASCIHKGNLIIPLSCSYLRRRIKVWKSKIKGKTHIWKQ